MQTIPASDFETHCRESLGELRAALIRLYDDLGLDPGNPQDVARHFKLNKTLTWKLAKVIGAPDDLTPVSHVPGTGAMQIFLRTMETAGAGKAAVADLRAAALRFDEMVELHVGDRPTLELVLDGMAPGSADRLEVSRKLAFRGNSGIWGVQARTRLAMNIVIPNKDNPAKLDMATIRGYSGFRRLRPSVRWPLFQVREWGTGGDAMVTRPNWEPIEGEPGENPANIMSSFTSRNLPEIRAEPTRDGTDFILMPGPVGNFGAIDCFQGKLMRSAVARYGSAEDPIGEFGSAISVPTKTLLVDLVVHEDLEPLLDARVIVLGQIDRQGQPANEESSATALPIVDELRSLSGKPPALATPLINDYPRMFEVVCARMGCAPEQMRAVRLEMKYPPLGSTVLLRFQLPDAP